MIERTCAFTAGALVLLLFGACASTSKQASHYPEEKIYRTGSNIPVKDYGAANIEVTSPAIIDPINRPTANVSNKKPGG